MSKQSLIAKRVVVHVGPHKTGSSAIQKWLHRNTSFLATHGISFLQNSVTHRAARLIAHEAYSDAEIALEEIKNAITLQPSPIVILSQEDFCGDLPGRSKKKGIYKRLLRNFRTLRRVLSPHSLTFVFFEREESAWLRSCYHQNLVHRPQFSKFVDFQDSLGEIPSWQNILARVKENFDHSLVQVPYRSEADAGIKDLLRVAGLTGLELPDQASVINRSPTPDIIEALESINSRSSFPQSAWFSKGLLLRGWSPRAPVQQDGDLNIMNESQAAFALPELFERVRSRFSTQDCLDLLPDENCDLHALLGKRLPEEREEPRLSRSDMADQSVILDYHFRGKSELAKLNAFCISYLRRGTPHTGKARRLFHRIWNECGVNLVNELSTRWLISTLQTFLDHGVSEQQRLIGASGYFYANMMKIYEGERAMDGLEQDAIVRNSEPVTQSKFRGLDRYRIGGSDLLLNTNALALELSALDDVAGLVLQEFLVRVKHSWNVFRRADATREQLKIDVAGFEDTWSFYQGPTNG